MIKGSELSKMKVNEDLSTIVRDMDVNDPESIENSIDEFVNTLRDVADPLFCKKRCTFQCTHGFHEPLPKLMCDDCKSLRNLFYKALNQYRLLKSAESRADTINGRKLYNSNSGKCHLLYDSSKHRDS